MGFESVLGWDYHHRTQFHERDSPSALCVCVCARSVYVCVRARMCVRSRVRVGVDYYHSTQFHEL